MNNEELLELAEEYEEKVNSFFEHHSGNTYILINIANIETTDLDKFPILCVYMSLKDGHIWARPVQDFHKSFKPLPPLSCDGCGVTDISVRPDGYGFNCCYNPCDEYAVRGISRSDFM